jgi:hypothetical protein
MESRPVSAEELPALYRAILEGAARLEALGARLEAGAIRTAASRAYMVWDDDGRRRLVGLLRRVERNLATESSAARTSSVLERANAVRANPRADGGAGAPPRPSEGLRVRLTPRRWQTGAAAPD